MVIPWDNGYAQYYDKTRCCGQRTCSHGKPWCFDGTTMMRPELIFNNTHYKLNPLIAEVIPVDTAKNDKEKAINMIKAILD